MCILHKILVFSIFILLHIINDINKRMDRLDDPYPLLLIYLVIVIPFNSFFSNEIFNSFKTRVIYYTRASVSAIICALGKKSKIIITCLV